MFNYSVNTDELYTLSAMSMSSSMKTTSTMSIRSSDSYIVWIVNTHYSMKIVSTSSTLSTMGITSTVFTSSTTSTMSAMRSVL